jgi:GNAT superfamily N-acetyltransferase
MSYDTGLSMEERVTSLFQPDTLLPDQYLDTFRRKLYLEPEKKLMLAILEDAIACYQKYIFARDGKGKALFHEAEEWVEERGSGNVFTFDSACESLGLNPEYLRRGVADWTKAALAQRAQAKSYQLAPRPQRPRRSAGVSRKATRRLRRAAGR